MQDVRTQYAGFEAKLGSPTMPASIFIDVLEYTPLVLITLIL